MDTLSLKKLKTELDSVRLPLCLGLFLISMVFWKGNGGYRDVSEYLDDAERLWLKGDMSLPEATGEWQLYLKEGTECDPSPEERAEYEAALRAAMYNRYSVGLAVISGPFVWAGAALEKITGGILRTRGVTALIVPLLGVLTALLIFEIGGLLRCSARVSFLTAIIFVLGGTTFSYMRLFFTEVAVAFFIVLSLWAFLQARCWLAAPESAQTQRAAQRWLLLCGAALAGATACHYGDVLISAGLGATFTGMLLFSRQAAWPKFHAIASLSVVPVLAGLALLWLHHSRYGALSPGGYSLDVNTQLRTDNFLFNLRYLLWVPLSESQAPGEGLYRFLHGSPGWAVRLPWVFGALLGFGWLARRECGLSVGLALALLAQSAFWLSYEALGYSPTRYLLPLNALLVLPLLCFADRLFQRWPRYMLEIASLCVAWNFVFLLRGDETHSLPLSTAPQSGEWLCYVWYMQPIPRELIDVQGTPVGLPQCAIALVLGLSGMVTLYLAGRKAWHLAAR